MTGTKPPAGRIDHLDTLARYEPAGHWGTQNARLVHHPTAGGYEMILGTMTADGGAERHRHDHNHQTMFILEGEALIELGDAPARRCPAGSVIEIPPGLAHRIAAGGDGTLRFLVVFSPPLAPAGEGRQPYDGTGPLPPRSG